MKTIKFLLVMLFSIVIAACGGGGGDNPPPAATFSISGAVSGAVLPGVAISLTGTSSASTTTDAMGNYSFTGLANGSYTVTPSLAGNSFSPAGTAVSVSGANVPNTNFVATALGVGVSTYSISGTVSDAATSSVTLTLSGANTGSQVSGAGGTYTFSNLLAGSYTITPSLTGFTFSPANKAVTLTTVNSTANDFTATAVVVPHSLSGNVSGVAGGLVTIDVTGAASASTTTDASGNYTVTGLFDGAYTVTPSKTGYTFAPSSTSVTMAGANVTGKNFAGTANSAVLATVNGTVTGAWVEGITITMSGGASGTTTTNASGAYSFANLPSGASYTFAPTALPGYNYSANAAATIPGGSNAAVSATNIVASSIVTSNSISGTVNYAGLQPGRISIKVVPSNCPNCAPFAGTTINAPGAFTIRGVSAGNWDIVAQMDTLGNGATNVNNPTGSITNVAAGSSGNTITLVDPSTPTATTPTGLAVFPSSNSAIVFWDQVKNAAGVKTATAYKISWGTDTLASNGGVVTVTSSDNTNYLQSGLTPGGNYFYKIASMVGNTTGTYSAVVGPITVNAATVGNTVSGTVTVNPSVTLTGPMYVGLYSTNAVYFTRFSTPTSTQIYSVTAATNGSYYPFVLVDMNNNGVIDAGDITNTNGNTANITVSGNMTNSITLSSASATARVRTNHDVTKNQYHLLFGVNDNSKQAVSATVISGVNVPLPLDIPVTQGNDVWVNSSIRPTTGDSYKLRVKFSDGTTQDMTVSVTGVLDSPAQNLTVVNNGTGGSTTTVPLFTWAAPASPPASYTYILNVSGNANWWFDNNGGLTATSALYNADGRASPASLVSGTTYNWGVWVEDGNRNQVTGQATPYTVP